MAPSSIARLLPEVIEPYHGRILDPACGSGGMFVQSARFVAEHKAAPPSTRPGGHPSPNGRRAGDEGAQYTVDPARELSIHGVEKTDETGRLCRLNLAVHGLEGEIKHGGQLNSYYDDPHTATGKFDFVLANPPFNVNAVDKERLKDSVGPGRRFPFGMPRTDNANYLWIQLFYSSLNEVGRAGFVMANSAADARSSEQELRKQLIESCAVDVMVAVGPNMFYTVTLPCTLWFFDKAKAGHPRPPDGRGAGGEGRAETVLFIDARHIYRQVDRAHREWTPAQIGFLANLVRLYRGEALDYTLGGDEAKAKIQEIFGEAAGRKTLHSQLPTLNSPPHTRPPLSRRSPRLHPRRRRSQSEDSGDIRRSRWQEDPQLSTLNSQLAPVSRCVRTLQGSNPERNRGPGLELKSGALRGRGRRRSRERRGFQGTTQNAERGTRNTQRRSTGTGGHDCR